MEEFEVENWRGVGVLVELNGSKLILWSMKYKYHICGMSHEVICKTNGNIDIYCSFFRNLCNISSIVTRSETGNVVYIDAILKSTQNSRVRWSVQLLSNFWGQIPNHLRDMIFSPRPDDFEELPLLS